MLLGEPDESDSQLVRGVAARSSDGKTSTFLFYTSGATSRIVHPDAVPERTQRDATIARTPYEDFVLSCIDGTRTVRAIQRASGLAPQEVVITLLTLLDKGVIKIEGERASSSAAHGELQEEEATVDAYQGAVP